jgi:hypothetical protein
MANETTYAKVNDFVVTKTIIKTITEETTFTLDALVKERDEWARRKAEFSATCDAQIKRLDTEIDALKSAGAKSYAEVTEAARLVEIAEG